MMLEYDIQTLSVVCPVCKAAITGRCLQSKLCGMEYMNEPHEARCKLAHQPPISKVETVYVDVHEEYEIYGEAPPDARLSQTEQAT
jgi:hypothetical protein